MESGIAEIGFLFDWDGVIVDSSAQHEESWERLAEAEGRSLFEGHFKLGFGKKNAFIIPNILKWTEDAAEIERLGDRKEAFYREIVEETGLEPLPGVKAFLDELRKAGCPSCVASSTPRENIEAVLKVIGLEGYFERIVAAADVSHGKPHPEVFLKAAEKIQMPPERCVVFEDSFSGIEAGQAAGAKVVALATTNAPEALQERKVDLVARSFEEISTEGVLRLFGS